MPTGGEPEALGIPSFEAASPTSPLEERRAPAARGRLLRKSPRGTTTFRS